MGRYVKRNLNWAKSMTQNINLLDELNIQPISTFNSRLIGQIALGWILLLTLIYILALGIHAGNQKTLATLETTQKNLLAEIAANQETISPPKVSTTTDSKVIPQSQINLLGFYRYLDDLAKFTPYGVWLNNIIFSEAEADKSITIKGSSIAPSGVSTFLNSLHGSTSLQNKNFGTMQLQKNATSSNIDFTLSTKEPDKK